MPVCGGAPGWSATTRCLLRPPAARAPYQFGQVLSAAVAVYGLCLDFILSRLLTHAGRTPPPPHPLVPIVGADVRPRAIEYLMMVELYFA